MSEFKKRCERPNKPNPNLDPNGSFFMPAQSSGISNPLGGYSRNKQCQTKLI